MTLIAQHTVPRGPSTSVPSLPRPTVRGLSLLAAVAFVLLLVDALIHPRAFFDLWAMKQVQAVDTPWLPGLMEVAERLTDSRGAVAAWGLVLLAFLAARWWVPAMALATLPFGGVINLAIGDFLVGRTRPHLAELVRDSGNFEERSFPSGHVQGAVMLYGLLFVVARRIAFRPLRLALRGVSLTIIALVGFSRIWDGAHWPTDVLGAYALGGLLLAGLVALSARLDAAIGHLPLIRATALPRDENRPHAHFLMFVGALATAKFITGAALVMGAAVGGFAAGWLAMPQQRGFRLAVAVFLAGRFERMPHESLCRSSSWTS